MHFEPRKGLRLADLPYFPEYEWNNDMTSTERQVCAGFYLARTVDYLQGRRQYEPPVRPHHDRRRNSQISKNIPLQSVCDGATEGDSAHSNRQERQDSGN
jgi:hypothetical protein